MPNNTTLDTRVLDSIIRNLGGNTRDAIAKVAFTLEGRAKINVRDMEAVDTGALLNSIATSLKSGGNTAAAEAEARQRNPDAGIVSLPVPMDDHTAYVGPSVDYAGDVEFGTGRMPARPYLQQAVRDTEKIFREMIGDAVVNR